MELCLSVAKESDAPRIADIHLAAFESNAMLLAQFPTAAVRAGLRTSLVEKAIAEMRDPKWTILVVRSEKDGDIVSFAKWCHPIQAGENYVEAPWRWPTGTNMAVLDKWTEKVEAAKKALGSTPCYCLSFIGTDPRRQRTGAASLLLRWGLERSKEENVPVVLESTTDATEFYEKFGFKAREQISMRLSGVMYEETCFVLEHT